MFGLLPVFATTCLQSSTLTVADSLKQKGLNELGAYRLLKQLSGEIGPRPAGSANSMKAIAWGEETMRRAGFANVQRLPCTVSHWVRGKTELASSGSHRYTCCALGNSPGGDVTGEVVEVHSLKDVEELGSKVKGKIVFYNRPFDQSLTNTFEAYGTAGDQRFAGPALAAKFGAVGTVVRSMTSDYDDVPHTGTTVMPKEGPVAPCAALGLVSADRLSEDLKEHPNLTLRLKLECKRMPDVPSFDVLGEITGSEKPHEVVVIGGHLDSWDKGRGAHDDGAGVAQALEALRLIHDLGWKPKRTIRVVLWMDEENSGGGSAAYTEFAGKGPETPVAAIESDSGGFAPRDFGSSLDDSDLKKFEEWLPEFRKFEIERFVAHGDTGADIESLAKYKTALFGLEPESQRYFDYHHSDKDTIDKVNPRELELGALSLSLLSWVLANE